MGLARIWGRLARLDEALDIASRRIRLVLGVESVNLWDAFGRVVASDVYARQDLPLFDRSAVDGYAIRSRDVVSASPNNPVRLQVVGLLKPGDEPVLRVGEGEAVEVYTGAPLPAGADAVVMYEDVRVGNGFIEVLKPVASGVNVSRRGEDFKAGECIVTKNALLMPWHLSAIAAQGSSSVVVYRRLRIGIISVGSELIPPGAPARPGEPGVYASTEYLVYSMLQPYRFIEARYYGIVGDDIREMAVAIDRALAENDMVITIAGTSVSKHDLVPEYVEENGEWIVRGIALRPGRTTSLALVRGKPLALVSGNPVAAWVALEAFIIPLIHRVLGVSEIPKPTVKAVLARRITNQIGFRTFVRVKLRYSDGTPIAEPFMTHGSSILSSLIRCHGYVVIEEDNEGFDEGEEVLVNIFNGPI